MTHTTKAETTMTGKTTDEPTQVEELVAIVADLKQRLRELEDVVEIQQLVATYGPAAEGTDEETFAQQWTEDGVYDLDVGIWRGHDELRKMFHSQWHDDNVRMGAAHLVSPPRITVDGDTAVVTNYLQLMRHTGFGGFSVVRQAAHRWDLVRTEDGWRTKYRRGRQLNGGPEAYEILASDL